MRARAVIGANFGDEGKGLVTDYLASKGGDVVVRFNGGAQAGHTVVTPSGRRHVFSHFGSGSLVGLPTFLSQHFIVNPALFVKELKELHAIGCRPKVFVHPDALVTTPPDMNSNQNIESARGGNRHGSCGVGVFQTIIRDRVAPLRAWQVTRPDLEPKLRGLLEEVAQRYSHYEWIDPFIKDCELFWEFADIRTIRDFNDPIFEGAQGLLLCQSNMEMYPHLTPSRCGLHNARALAYEGGFTISDAYYVSRTYMTRHGAGPLPNETSAMSFEDKTNVENEWQGPLRFAPMDWSDLLMRIHADCSKPLLAVTHADQLDRVNETTRVALKSYGETRDDIRTK